jgi:DNA-directed RNA polymerase beta' subunit
LKESRGEVLKPEISTTVRTKPERDGLSVKEYFGPVKILNVRKRIRYKGSSVTVVVLKLRKVRRDRVGHINLLCQLLISGISVLFQIKLVISLVFHLRN